MNFCPNCGAKITENAKFCTSCGQPLAEPTISTNNESAEEDNIYSVDDNEDDILDEETNEIDDNKEEDYENNEDDNDDEDEEDDEEEIPPISPTDAAIIDYLKTRKDFSSSDTIRTIIALIVGFLLTLLCTAILLGVILGLIGCLWGIGGEVIGGVWGKVIIGICKAVLILGFIPGIYRLYRFFKMLYSIIFVLLINLFCLIYIRKHKKEICSELSISNEEVRAFYKKQKNIDALTD